MRLVLDTNVLVAGLLSPFGPPGRIVVLLNDGLLEPCTDARVIAEYEDVLRRPKFGFEPDVIDALIGAIERHGLLVAAPPLPVRLPHDDDDQFVEVGLAAGARCLVTGNGVHFPAERCLGLPVLSPAELIEVVRRLKGVGRSAGGRSPD